MKQEYIVRFINHIGTHRWQPEIHSDGCKTPADVFARIAAKRPSRHHESPGVPQWDNPTFQTLFQTLDMEQRHALARVVLNFVSIISGPPGSGKTKTGETIFHLFGGGESVMPLAPYGRIS